jgi:carbon-monoxide dehydrogenase small subunit
MPRRLRITLNGEPAVLPIEWDWTLVRALREGAGLTGTKEGCGTGACGACTVLVDGAPVYACLMLAATVAGTSVTTVEGLGARTAASAVGDPASMHPLQQAFVDHGAIQCGFCTPGILMAAAAYLAAEPRPDEAGVREAIGGNICRCTGYAKIVQAILAAAAEASSELGVIHS